MELTPLRYFRTIVRVGHMTRAAAELGQPLHRRHRRRSLFALRVLIERLGEFGLDETGADRIGADARRAEFGGDVPHQSQQRDLGNVVGADLQRGFEGADGGGEDH